MNALYRPGPIGRMIDDFIQRKQGEEDRLSSTRACEPILEETYGVIVYQEQVMQIAVRGRRLLPGRGRHAAQGDGQEEGGDHGQTSGSFVDGAAGPRYPRPRAARALR